MTRRRTMIVWASLAASMAGSYALLSTALPLGHGRAERPAESAAKAARTVSEPEPLSADALATERNWTAIEVRLAAADSAGADTYHFVIAPGSGDAGPVTTVRPLWRRQGVSLLEPEARPGESVLIALEPETESRSPTPGQWQALGLLVRRLRDRYGVERVVLDTPLQGDPRSREVRLAANW